MLECNELSNLTADLAPLVVRLNALIFQTWFTIRQNNPCPQIPAAIQSKSSTQMSVATGRAAGNAPADDVLVEPQVQVKWEASF